MTKIITILALFFFMAVGARCFAQTLSWTEVTPGVWKGVIGVPEPYNLLKAAGTVPNTTAIGKITPAGFPFNEKDISAIIGDNKTCLRFPLNKTEQLYGFGLNFQSVNQRGKILQLHVDHYGGKDNGRTHAPTPFYVSSKGYGVFINSARYLTVYAGTAVRKDSRKHLRNTIETRIKTGMHSLIRMQ